MRRNPTTKVVAQRERTCVLDGVVKLLNQPSLKSVPPLETLLYEIIIYFILSQFESGVLLLSHKSTLNNIILNSQPKLSPRSMYRSFYSVFIPVLLRLMEKAMGPLSP